jgi:nitrite reductase (NADH) large subunit
MRTATAVMNATRAGKGCGSCKGLVHELVDWFCGGEAEVDPSIHYYVPCIPLAKPELVRAIVEQELRSVSSVFAALSPAGEDAASKPALSSLLSTVWKGLYEDERDARFINDRVHGNIQKDGTFSVIPEMAGGVCTPDQLRRIADVADKYAVPLVKLTGGQRIDLVGIPKAQLPAVWTDLGMPAGYAWGKSYRTCKSCIGSDFCRFGLGDSMALANKIETKFRGIDSPGKLKLATAGCPRNCSEALVKDVGAVAVEGGKWEIYVGGAAGSHIRKGDLLCTVETHDEVLKISGRFMQWYRENAKYKERTFTFIERVGIERVRAVVLDDADGIAEALDAAMDKSCAEALKDPWKEATTPKTVNQFADLIPAGEA